MKARVLAHGDVGAWVDRLRLERTVIAPFRGRGRDTFFDVVTDQNRDRIEMHLPNPYYPPKRFVLPHLERMFRIQGGNGEVRIEPVDESRPLVLFGIRSCDVAGIAHLDRFYLGRQYRDVYYERRRRNLFLVNMVCTDPEQDIDSVCFCVCADTGPAARDHFDLQMMDLGDEFLVVAGSEAGEAWFKEPWFRPATAAHVERRRELLAEVRKQFKTTTSWFPATVRYVSQGAVLDQTWSEIGHRCLECGGCTYVCPACTCFTVSDRRVGEGQIERVRLWDSCALDGFTRMAGGFNPRRAVHDRRNRRFFRKLAHYFIQRELSMACVGCGRCAAVCHGDVGMPSVVEMIRRASLAPAAPAQ
jgi:sulfhydrogenase subunit beta (sulfur reductase)